MNFFCSRWKLVFEELLNLDTVGWSKILKLLFLPQFGAFSRAFDHITGFSSEDED